MHSIFEINQFPILVDYDFKKRNTRGFSSKLDLITFGAFSEHLNTFNESSHILFIKRKNLIINEAICVVDYSDTHSEAFQDLYKYISSLNPPIIYIFKNSLNYKKSLQGIVDGIEIEELEII